MRNIHKFTVHGKPRSKGRPRFNPKTRTAFTPADTRAYEKHVAESYDGPEFGGPVNVELHYYKDRTDVTIVDSLIPKSKLRGDLDNMVKATLDGLQGHAYANDKQIVSVTARDYSGVEGKSEATI